VGEHGFDLYPLALPSYPIPPQNTVEIPKPSRRSLTDVFVRHIWAVGASRQRAGSAAAGRPHTGGRTARPLPEPLALPCSALRFIMLRGLTLLAVATSASAGAVDLTLDNFDTLITKTGKAALIKFFAPWCGHCKKMKPDWDALGDVYEDSKTVLIGDADCTAAGKSLCEKHGVRGYPTLK